METLQIARAVEQQFGLPIDRADVVKQKTHSVVYQLHGRGRSVFLKLWIDPFSRSRVAEEAAFVGYLAESGCRAPALVRAPSGGNLLECTVDGASACGYLTEDVRVARPGIDIDNPAHLKMAARRLAELHRRTDVLARDFTAVSWDARWLIDRSLQIIEPLFDERPRDFAAIRAAFDGVKEVLAHAWKKTEGVWGIVHGDWHATNVVVGMDGDVWFLDFESFGNGWRLHDIVYLLGQSVRPEGLLELEAVRERYAVFMKEYAKRGPSIGAGSEFPTAWLAIRLLLEFGRQVRALPAGGPHWFRGGAGIASFVEKVRALTSDHSAALE